MPRLGRGAARPCAAVGVRKAPGTRHRRLMLIALAIAAVLIGIAVLYSGVPLGPPAPLE